MKKTNQNIHDGCHITPDWNHFEWWYFDFNLESHHNVYLEWHAPIFNLRDDHCILICRTYNNEEYPSSGKDNVVPSVKAFRYHHSTVKQSKSLCRIEFPAGHIIEEKNKYLIKIQEKNLQADLRLDRLLPPLISDQEIIYQSFDAKEYFSWNIPLPKAKVSGEIQIDHQHIEMAGIAYHDHNWGNLNFGKYLRGWNWARALFEDYTFLFGDIVPKEKQKNSQVLVLCDKSGTKIIPEKLNIHYSFSTNQSLLELTMPDETIISFQEGKRAYRIHFHVENSICREEAPLGSHNNHHINALLTKAYYLFRINAAPEILRKYFSRLVYYQTYTRVELFINNQLCDNTYGKFEVLSFLY